jgi:hypothetical protein
MSLQDKLEQAKKDIKIAVEAAGVEIADLEKQIADSEVVYSIGDRFVSGTGKCILVRIGLDKFGIVSLSTGNYHYGEFEKPEDCDRITPDELLAIYSGELTRYWDARKQCKC